MSRSGSSNGLVVAVTGANGFLASHIVDQLLKEGHTVRATVRNQKDTKKISHLIDLTKSRWVEREGHLIWFFLKLFFFFLSSCRGRLEFFDADLTKSGSFDGAFCGADVVMHVAAPVVMKSSNPMRDIVEPALRGADDILKSVERSGSVQHFILTSSQETVHDAHEKHPWERDDDGDDPNGSGLPSTGSDGSHWNTHADISGPYTLAKVQSEQSVLDAFRNRPSLSGIRLTILLPGWIMGPPMSSLPPPPVSLEPFLALGSGEYPFIPQLSVQPVDVRDCAAAHILSMKLSTSDRILRIPLCSPHVLSLYDMVDVCRQVDPSLPWASLIMPNWMMYAACLFDSRLSWGYVRDNVGRRYRMQSAPSSRLLGVQYRPLKQSFGDTLKALKENGMLVRRPNRIVQASIIAIVVLTFAFFLYTLIF